MTERGLNPTSLSKRAGLNQTFVRDTIQRGTTPSSENVRKLADALDVSPGYLMDDLSELSPDERLFVETLRRLDRRGRAAVQSLAAALEQEQDAEDDASEQP